MLLRKYEGNPILAPESAHPWESLVRTNPGAWYDADARTVFMLYRAAGHDAEHVVRLGLASSVDGYRFTPASDQPVFGPVPGGFDGGCIEDPRIVKIGDWYYVTYACRMFPPGQYWLPREQRPARLVRPAYPAEFPANVRSNLTATGLALTRDFRTWIRAGRLTSPALDDRDVFFLPERVNGKWVMLHRPMSWTGAAYGTAAPAIWINTSADLLDWDYTASRLLAKAAYPWETKIGGNAPPIRTEPGWLTIYHGVGPDKHYRLGAMLLDLSDPARVTHRLPEPILEPTADCETKGCYGGGGVVFPCGNVVIDGTLFVYYGGADKYVCVATCPLDELVGELLAHPV
ncbi:MAG: glycosidase [Kiritimatiellae bacterium]|nr:glycosidase [Kiritimatiellia bacterium]